MREVGGSSPSSPTPSHSLLASIETARRPGQGVGPAANLQHGRPHLRVALELGTILPVEGHGGIGQQSLGIAKDLGGSHLKPPAAPASSDSAGAIPSIHHVQAEGQTETERVGLGAFTDTKPRNFSVPTGCVAVLSPGPSHPFPVVIH